MFPSTPTGTSSYQVTEDDKDFLTLAARLNVNYNQLKAANPYVQSLSQGQFINVPGGAVSPEAQLEAQREFTEAAQQKFGQPGYKPPQSRSLVVNAAAQGFADRQRAPVPAYPMVTPNAQANAWLAGQPTPNAPASTNTGYFKERTQAGVDAALNQFATTGTLPPNLSMEIEQQLIAQGADPAKLQQAKQKGAQTAAQANDPLAGTPGHYYVDEKTAPFVGQIITLRDGSRKRLLTDKNGRLYYAKPTMSRRGYAKRAARRRAQAGPTAAQLAAHHAAELAALVRGDNAVTSLNVVMGA